MIHCTQVCMPHGVPSDHASGKLVQVAATKDDSEKTPVHWHKYDPYQTLAEHNVKQQYDERRPNCLVQCAKTMPTAHCAKVCTEDLRHPFGEASLVEKEEKKSPGQDCLMGCSKSGQSMLHCAKVCTADAPKDHGGKLVQVAKEAKNSPGQDCLTGCSKSGQSMLHCAKVCTANGPKDHGGKFLQIGAKEVDDPHRDCVTGCTRSGLYASEGPVREQA